MQIDSPSVLATQRPASELDRLGNEIAELSGHLDAATARLLELIRAFFPRRRPSGWRATPAGW
jgi:hypothetical protein